jgi:hypothetical protein
MEWAWFGLGVAFLLIAMIAVGHLGRIADAVAQREARERRGRSPRANGR